MIGRVSHASAAGVTWWLVIASAPWAARAFHTSVVDAAGAIYVLGGFNGGTYYKDVWVSTDGGARAGLVPGGGRGVHQVGTRGGTQAATGVVVGYSHVVGRMLRCN